MRGRFVFSVLLATIAQASVISHSSVLSRRSREMSSPSEAGFEITSPSEKFLTRRMSRDQQRSDFYYGVAGVLVIFLGAALWIGWKQKKQRDRNRELGLPLNARPGQYLGPYQRRWVMGRWNDHGNGLFHTTRADEGLDASGEAPPAYKPAESGGNTLPANGMPVQDEHIVTIPLETYQRGETLPQPPAYYERQGQSTEDLNMTRPEAAHFGPSQTVQPADGVSGMSSPQAPGDSLPKASPSGEATESKAPNRGPLEDASSSTGPTSSRPPPTESPPYEAPTAGTLHSNGSFQATK